MVLNYLIMKDNIKKYLLNIHLLFEEKDLKLLKNSIPYHWEKMLSCMDYHNNHHAALLFYQIRYMYELTGYGLQYTENKINEALGSLGAKYFIYYYPNAGVRVISTASIINNLINAVRDDNLWKYNVKDITKEYALYAKLKMRMRNGIFEFG